MLAVRSEQDLQPLTQVLLNEADSYIKVLGYETLSLEWQDFAQDQEIFFEVITLLVESSTVPDYNFNGQVLPFIIEQLDKMVLYHLLDYSNIKVSPAHEGKTPYLHSIGVTKKLHTDYLQDLCLDLDDAKLLKILHTLIAVVRASGVFHDIAKMLTATLPEERVRDLLAEFDHTYHGYPDHEVLAHAILKKLFDNSLSYKKDTSKVDFNSFKQYLLLVVLNHHAFARLGVIGDEYAQQLIEELESNFFSLQRENSLLVLGLIYLLTRADIMDTPAHHQHWTKNSNLFKEIIEKFGSNLDLEVKLILESILSVHDFTKENSEDSLNQLEEN